MKTLFQIIYFSIVTPKPLLIRIAQHMMKKKLHSLLLIAIFGNLVALATAEVTTNQFFDTNFFVQNPCTGDNLYLSGKFHYLVKWQRYQGTSSYTILNLTYCS
jgi:hypothetical protein